MKLMILLYYVDYSTNNKRCPINLAIPPRTYPHTTHSKLSPYSLPFFGFATILSQMEAADWVPGVCSQGMIHASVTRPTPMPVSYRLDSAVFALLMTTLRLFIMHPT